MDCFNLTMPMPIIIRYKLKCFIMFVCDIQYSDFCACTFGTNVDLHVECIYRDDDFWEDCVYKT